MEMDKESNTSSETNSRAVSGSVFSCLNCSYVIELPETDNLLLPPCPCCESRNYIECVSAESRTEI